MSKTKHTTREEFRDVPGFPGYQVSRLGRFRTSLTWRKHAPLPRGQWRYINRKPGSPGYILMTLFRDGRPHPRFLHRLVLETFVGPCPEGMEACHYDGDKTNNSLANLRWDTRKANIGDRIRHGTMNMPCGSRHFRAKLTEADIPKIRKLYRSGLLIREIAAQFNVGYSAIRSVLIGRLWKHVPG